MNGEQINQKIRYGYAKAAKKLGSPYDLYRASTPFTPIQIGNFVGTLPMVPSQDWTWMKANRPGNAIWYMCIDGQDASAPLDAQEGDYLIGLKTFFVLSKEYQMPMQAVECNKLIDLIRPTQSNSAGYTPGSYAAYVEGNSDQIMQNMPISMLVANRQGSRADSKLPTDTNQPQWLCLMPNLGDVDVRTGDIIVGLSDTDPSQMAGVVNTNDRFVVSGTEETEFGWRLTCMQTMN
jgi:hypothetical protein